MFIVFWYRNGWRNGCVDMLRAGRFSMVFSMLVSSTCRVALSSLLFGRHSWDTGFYRVGCVFAMLIDGRFDATSRRSSRSIRQSLSLTILMENRWKINRKSHSNVVLHQIRPQDRSWERFCLHFTLWGVLLGAPGCPWATLGAPLGDLGTLQGCPGRLLGLPRGSRGTLRGPTWDLLGSLGLPGWIWEGFDFPKP